MTMRWFGEPWGAKICDTAPRVPTPVGAPCFLCPEVIDEDDQGFVVPTFGRSAAYAITHRGCFIQSLLGYGIGSSPWRRALDGRSGEPHVRHDRPAAHSDHAVAEVVPFPRTTAR
jgi:hypothetical protein